MKRWALLVTGLYFLILVVLTFPVILGAFAGDIPVADAAKAYAHWPYWLWVVVMTLCQAALLTVPVRVASRRPVTHRSLLLPVIATGLLAGCLAAGALYSIGEFALRDHAGEPWILWSGIGLGIATWSFWAMAFYRMGRNSEPEDFISRQCQWLFRGSILELLIAVPTHIVARYRDYCCAGFMTFLGLTFGLAVMLFSFGPAVFFLYAQRWKRLHPSQVGRLPHVREG